MYLSRSQPEALALALLSMCCWGSWSNTLVYCGEQLRFELFYLDYVWGVLQTSLLFAVTLGMLSVEGSVDAHWIPDDWHVEGVHVAQALFAGALFNVGNLLLVKGIQMCGLAVAFPLGIGTALVLGTVLTHFMEASSGVNATLLFLGVAVAFAAVCTTSFVHRLKDGGAPSDHSSSDSEESSSADGSGDESGPKSVSMAHKLLLCVAAGVLLSLWSPLNARAQQGFPAGGGLSPYGTFFLFSVGITLSSLLLLPLVLTWPIDRGQRVPLGVALKEYGRAPCGLHSYGLFGGAVWALGTLANAVSGQLLSFAASYAIGQSAPMVAMCWGVFHFREFDGTPGSVKGLLALVFLLYIVSIALIAMSH